VAVMDAQARKGRVPQPRAVEQPRSRSAPLL
jgi:hypothetical protein